MEGVWESLGHQQQLLSELDFTEVQLASEDQEALFPDTQSEFESGFQGAPEETTLTAQNDHKPNNNEPDKPNNEPNKKSNSKEPNEPNKKEPNEPTNKPNDNEPNNKPNDDNKCVGDFPLLSPPPNFPSHLENHPLLAHLNTKTKTRTDRGGFSMLTLTEENRIRMNETSEEYIAKLEQRLFNLNSKKLSEEKESSFGGLSEREWSNFGGGEYVPLTDDIEDVPILPYWKNEEKDYKEWEEWKAQGFRILDEQSENSFETHTVVDSGNEDLGHDGVESEAENTEDNEQNNNNNDNTNTTTTTASEDVQIRDEEDEAWGCGVEEGSGWQMLHDEDDAL